MGATFLAEDGLQSVPALFKRNATTLANARVRARAIPAPRTNPRGLRFVIGRGLGATIAQSRAQQCRDTDFAGLGTA